MARAAGVVVASIVICTATVSLVRYVGYYFLSWHETQMLRAEYLDSPITTFETCSPISTVLETTVPTALDTAPPLPSPEPIDLVNLSTLAPMPYPKNPYRMISTKFDKLRRRNSDIIGWLHIEDVLDEAVVQRDNSYYLRRDYLGYHNDNGALFLDQNCDLSIRPSDYIIYGHNMKTGAMFGSLRDYEKYAFYKEHVIIHFDTMYEEGEYVVFSVAQININRGTTSYAPILLLPYSTIGDRTACIEKLMQLSIYRTPLEVLATDQLLFLVTCDGNDNERRVISARRVRDDENLEDIITMARRAYPQ